MRSTNSSARRTSSVSSSRSFARQAPTAFTCAPALIHAPFTMGVVDAVTVQMISASATAACAEEAHETRTAGYRLAVSALNFSAWAGFGPHTWIFVIGRTSSIASICVRACSPVPITARVAASGFASSLVATALTAAVRMAVIRVPSTIASN
ncbi:hypothetical protein D3C84_855760 [compost metagenome]